MKPIYIRDYRDADIEAVVAIATTAWAPVFISYRDILGDVIYQGAFPDWKADKERQIRSSADSYSPVSFIVAEVDQDVAGFASFVIGSEGIGEIGNNAVNPTYQNRGIATLLYGEVQKRMRTAGVRVVKVTTGLDPSHAPARRAYEKAGFTRSLPMTTYYKDLADI